MIIGIDVNGCGVVFNGDEYLISDVCMDEDAGIENMHENFNVEDEINDNYDIPQFLWDYIDKDELEDALLSDRDWRDDYDDWEFIGHGYYFIDEIERVKNINDVELTKCFIDDVDLKYLKEMGDEVYSSFYEYLSNKYDDVEYWDKMVEEI